MLKFIVGVRGGGLTLFAVFDAEDQEQILKENLKKSPLKKLYQDDEKKKKKKK